MTMLELLPENMSLWKGGAERCSAAADSSLEQPSDGPLAAIRPDCSSCWRMLPAGCLVCHPR